jgi:hypothetical protein
MNAKASGKRFCRGWILSKDSHAASQGVIFMTGKATDVSILMDQIYYPRARPHQYKTTYTVKFYSIPKRCWCSFKHVEGDDYGTSSNVVVFVDSPRSKTISLYSASQSFKVGKVSCQLAHRKSTKGGYWIIDDAEYTFNT